MENLTPDRPSFALEFGSATHIFLQERRRGVPLDQAIKMGQQRLLERFPTPLFPEDEDLLLQHREMALNLWPAYEAHWSHDDEQFIPLGQEIKGRVEVGSGSNVFLVFQLDRLVSWVNAFWLWDYKTMAKNDDRTFQKFELDIQPTAYVYGASKVLGQRVAGIVIDGLIKTKTPQFRREHYLRTDAELVEFEQEFVEIMQEIAWRHVRVQNGEPWKTVFFKNTDHCFRYYRCPFQQLCANDTPIARMAYRQRDVDYMDDPTILDHAEAK